MREIRSLRAMWRGLENQLTVRLVSHSQRKRGATDRPNLRSNGASPRPYRLTADQGLGLWCLSAWLAQLNPSLDRVAQYQNMNFIPNCSIRGVQLSRPLPVEVVLPNVAEETFRSGAAQKLTRLNVL